MSYTYQFNSKSAKHFFAQYVELKAFINLGHTKIRIALIITALKGVQKLKKL